MGRLESRKLYNDWLYRNRLVDDIFISIKKDKVRIAYGSEAEVSVLTVQQVQQFLFHLENESELNRLMGYLLLYTGARVSELVGIQRSHVDPVAAVLVVKGKGKLREVPLRQDVLKHLQGYGKGERATNKHRDSPHLLLSQRSAHLHRDSVRSWLESVGKQLGFHIHPHMLRNTFCTALLRKGVEFINRVKASWAYERQYECPILHSEFKRRKAISGRVIVKLVTNRKKELKSEQLATATCSFFMFYGLMNWFFRILMNVHILDTFREWAKNISK